MNASIAAVSKVQSFIVREHARMGTLQRHFGEHMLTVEGRIYDFLSRFCATYDGGYWRFFHLSNGGFYMSPPEGTYGMDVESNGFQGCMSADATGITVCLFAFSHMSFEYTDDMFSTHFHWLRDFAMDHPEAAQIFAAID